MSEEVKTKQGEDRISYFYQDDKSKGEYMAPIVFKLKKGLQLSPGEKKIYKDFKEFEEKKLPSHHTLRPLKLENKNCEEIDTAFTNLFFFNIFKGLDSNAEKKGVLKEKEISEKYKKIFDEFGSRLDLGLVEAEYVCNLFENLKADNLEVSTKRLLLELEEEIERKLVNDLVSKIRTTHYQYTSSDSFGPEDIKVENKDGASDDPDKKQGQCEDASAAKEENNKDGEDIIRIYDTDLEDMYSEKTDCFAETMQDTEIIKNAIEEAVEKIEIEDERTFYQHDERYKHYKKDGVRALSVEDRYWVRQTLSNDLVAQEGVLAVVFVLFTPWRKCSTKDKKQYTLKVATDYIAYKGLSVDLDEKNKIIFKRCLGPSLNDKKELLKNCKPSEQKSIFQDLLVEMFEERKPDILEN